MNLKERIVSLLGIMLVTAIIGTVTCLALAAYAVWTIFVPHS